MNSPRFSRHAVLGVSLRLPLRFHSTLGITALGAMALGVSFASPAQAQSFRFILRAEPDVIAANGISTTSIFVQLPQNGGAISASPMVRFATTAGTIESQAQLSGGVARVLLRSSNTPGTAIVTAFIGSSREAITVEFSEDNTIAQRTLEVAAPYVAYGADESQITASGQAGFDFGDTHIESDVRLDVDLASERVWAQGTKGRVLIRQGRGAKAKELRGDRLFYDLRRKRGVIRRSESEGDLPARQEFVGADFVAPPENAPDEASQNVTLQNAPIPSKAGDKSSPPPSKTLETPETRGSIFVAPTSPPLTGAPSEKNDRPDALTPPVLIPAPPETSSTAEKSPATAGANPPIAVEKSEAGAENSAVSTVVPGSLAATPGNLALGATENQESRAQSLINTRRAQENGATTGESTGTLPEAPAYAPLPQNSGPTPRVVELPPPVIDAARGYWVASRRVRVFPRDKVQFERASIFFNGKKAFALPLYVLPLDGSFNPTTDTIAFNSQGGLALKFPFYYQASKGGTGAIFLKREQTHGFSTQAGGFSLALDQQYWLSPRSNGRFSVDQIGQGPFNLNYQHEMRFSPDTTGAFYLNAPRHRDLFARASLSKELRDLNLGFEGFYDKPNQETGNVRGQFFARMRPKSLGKSGWSATLSANALAVQRSARTLITNSTNGDAGGGLGGGLGGSTGSNGAQTRTIFRPLFGQTVNASVQSPLLSPWRGSSFTANLLATGFNYSDGRRGFAPGVNLSFAQKLGIADMRVDYTYDRSNLGLYGVAGAAFTNYVSGNLTAQLSKQIGLSSFLSRSLSDGSTYGSADMSYAFAPKWRAGLFSDYSSFKGSDSIFNYGWSVGRTIGTREVSVNYDANRGRVYFELGNGRY